MQAHNRERYEYRQQVANRATVSVDRINFLNPVYIGDEVSLYAELERVGRTSRTIMVEAWRRPRDSEAQVQVREATFVFVALDHEGRPRVVPATTSATGGAG